MTAPRPTRSRRVDQDKPVLSRVALDLDALEREGAGPFEVRLGGRVWTFADAMDLDYNDVMNAGEDPIGFLRIALPPDDVDDFFALRIPLWKLQRLVTTYMEHSGVPLPGEATASRT